MDVLATENIDPVASYSAWRKKKDTETLQGTQAMMESFLKQHSAYDVLPVSYRQIVMDTTLLVKKALSVLMQYGNLYAAYPNRSHTCLFPFCQDNLFLYCSLSNHTF